MTPNTQAAPHSAATTTPSRSETETYRKNDAAQDGRRNIQQVGDGNTVVVRDVRLGGTPLAVCVATLLYSYALMRYVATGMPASPDELMFFGAPMIAGTISAAYIDG